MMSIRSFFKQVVLTTPLTHITRFLDIDKEALRRIVNPLIRMGKLFLLIVRNRKLTYNASSEISFAH